MSSDRNDNEKIEQAQNDVLPNLARFRSRVRRQLLLEGATLILGVMVLMAFASLFLDRWLHLSFMIRSSLLFAGIVFMLYLFMRFIGKAMDARLDYIELARVLDRSSPGLSQRLASVLQLPDRLEETSTNSRALVETAVLHNAKWLKEIDFDRFIDSRRILLTGFLLALFVLLPIGLATGFSDTSRLWAKRWFLGSNVGWPQETYLQVHGLKDGVILVPRGEAYVLRVSAKKGSLAPEFIRLRTRDSHGEKIDATLTKFADNDYRYTFESIQMALEVRLRGHDDRYGPITIRPVDRPRIQHMKLTAKHPAETEPTVFNFTGRDADLAFLPDTELALEVDPNAELISATIRASEGMPDRLEKTVEGKYTAQWTHKDMNEIEINLVSAEGNVPARPVAFTVGLLKDRPPYVNLRVSGVRLRVTPQATVPLSVQARDDYGLSRVILETKTGSMGTNKVEKTESKLVLYEKGDQRPEKDVKTTRRIELKSHTLQPGMIWQVKSISEDFCYAGAQTGRSRELIFSVVRPEDLYREIILNLQGKRAVFRKAFEQAEEIRRKLEVGPLNAKNASEWVRNMRVIQQRVSSVHQGFNDALVEMKLNGLGNQESHDLILRQVIEPLKGLKDERLPEQILRLTRLNDSTPVDQMEETLDRQLALVTEMKGILKNMSQWESFVDVLNQLDEVLQIEKKVLENTEKAAEKVIESLFDD